MAICQYLTQDQESTKFEPFRGFLGLGLTLTKARNGVKNRFGFFSFSTHYMASKPNTKVCHTKNLFRCQKKFHLESLRPDFGTEKGQI